MAKILSKQHKSSLTLAVSILEYHGENALAKKVQAAVDAREVPDGFLTEYRVGRNFIRLGDTVKITSSPGKRDTYRGVVKRIYSDGRMSVYGARTSRVPMERTYPLDRIQRVAQSRVETPKHAWKP